MPVRTHSNASRAPIENLRRRAPALAILSLSLGLLACAPASVRQLDQANFKTRISPQGLKHFELRARGIKLSNSERNAQNRQAKPSSRTDFKKAKNKMETAAREMIKANGFCLSGFWVLDFDRDIHGYYLRGECNEAASSQDRKQYPDTLSHW